jgi:hypothetical protein
MNRTKRLEPEQLCENILAFDKELCNLTFLSELNNLLPTPEQVSRNRTATFCHAAHSI